MGTFREKILLRNSEDPSKQKELEAIVDSGATYTWVPQDILKSLGIRPITKRKIKIANGTVLEREFGIALIYLNQEVLPTYVCFGDEGSEPLLGAVTLEGFGLAIDPVNQILIPVPQLMV
jgi:clan AA aspartic protease